MPNGDVFTGKFENLHKVEGKQVYSDGTVYEGQWKQTGDDYAKDIWHGEGSLTHPDGKKSVTEPPLLSPLQIAQSNRYKGQWYKGNKTGKGVMTMEDGREYTGEWFMGQQQGVRDDLTIAWRPDHLHCCVRTRCSKNAKWRGIRRRMGKWASPRGRSSKASPFSKQRVCGTGGVPRAVRRWSMAWRWNGAVPRWCKVYRMVQRRKLRWAWCCGVCR